MQPFATPFDPAASRLAVIAHLEAAFGPHSGKGSVTFLGTESIDVLRFGPGPDGLIRYATVGMSIHPMSSAGAGTVDPAGPRAELLLSLRARPGSGHPGVLRSLAILASSPAVEGVVIGPGASLTLGGPLFEGSSAVAVLLAEPGGQVEDLQLEGAVAPVRFLPLLPLTEEEAAFKRIHGAAALEERWLAYGTDLRDPARASVVLE
ncbi:MAG TPA: suppressor of fused domain protein [Frankiaceae bacterium]|nr:suppressor of fused domain protein [Frankiaceae bacterium]